MLSRSTRALVAAFTFALAAAPSMAQNFTYQGKLQDAGLPASGNFDMQFQVFPVAVGGVQIGVTDTRLGVPVVDGLFSTEVSAISGAAIGPDLFLAIAIRPAGSPGPFTPISPRTRITVAPLAQKSLSERWTQVGSTLRTDAGVSTVFINTSTNILPDSALTVSRNTSPADPYAGMYVGGTDAGTLAYYGWFANGVSKAEATVSGTTGNFALNVGSSATDDLTVTRAGLVGLGVVPAGPERLRVGGDAVVVGDSKATTFSYASPRVKTLGIPPEAFRAAISTQQGFFGSGGGDAFLDSTVTSGGMVAPVYLPDGAVITAFEVVCRDNSVTADLTISLSRRLYAAGTYNLMASVSTVGASLGALTLADTSIVDATVDNGTNVYMINAFCTDWAGSTTTVKGVKITYTLSGPQ
jgi:hypothetical protein